MMTYLCYYYNDSNMLECVEFEAKEELPIKEIIFLVSDLYNVNVMGATRKDDI